MPDIKLKSMKIDAKEQETMSKPTALVDRPSYPWGLGLNLDNETLKKLELGGLPPVGRSMILVARVDVVNVSEHEAKGEDGKTVANRHVGLQITEMGLGENEDSEKPAAQDVLYKK
jgi:hypothetical protein